MLELFHNRNYFLLWLARVISSIGDILYTVGVMVTIFEQTGSAVQTAGVMVATTLPPFLLGPVAGAYVDRHSRRFVLILMDLIRAALVGILLLFGSQGEVNVGLIYLIVAGIASATAFYDPAHLALIPSLVERDQLVRANSIMIGTKQATLAIGYIAGGILILTIPFSIIVALNLATFLFAALLIFLIQLPSAKVRQRSTATTLSMSQSIREGAGYLRHHAIARPLVVMEVIEHVPHGVWTSALMLVFVERALSGQPSDWGYVNALFFIGMFVGAVAASALASPLNHWPGWVIIVNAFISAILTVAFAFSPSIYVAMIIAFAFGPPMAMRDVAQDTLLQVSVDEGMMGRVYAIRNMFRNAVFMVAGLLFAWMADGVNIRMIYLAAGLLYFGTGIYALGSQALRQSKIEGEAAAVPVSID